MQSEMLLDQFIDELEQIKNAKTTNELNSISLRCTASIAFTDRYMEEISAAQSELAVYLGDLRRQASELKMECDKLERNKGLKTSSLSAVQEAYEEIVGLIENVCLCLNPALVERADAAAI